MTENEDIKTYEELGCEIACEIIAKVNEKAIEFEAKAMDITLGKWGYCKADIEKALVELQEYRKIGTVEECREAVGKTRVRTMLESEHKGIQFFQCPECDEQLCKTDRYCPECGCRVESEE